MSPFLLNVCYTNTLITKALFLVIVIDSHFLFFDTFLPPPWIILCIAISLLCHPTTMYQATWFLKLLYFICLLSLLCIILSYLSGNELWGLYLWFPYFPLAIIWLSSNFLVLFCLLVCLFLDRFLCVTLAIL